MERLVRVLPLLWERGFHPQTHLRHQVKHRMNGASSNVHMISTMNKTIYTDTFAVKTTAIKRALNECVRVGTETMLYVQFILKLTNKNCTEQKLQYSIVLICAVLSQGFIFAVHLSKAVFLFQEYSWGTMLWWAKRVQNLQHQGTARLNCPVIHTLAPKDGDG